MSTPKRVWVAACFDTKGDEAEYVCGLLEDAGLSVGLVDVSTSGDYLAPSHPRSANRIQISPADIIKFHPEGVTELFKADRGTAIVEMSAAFEAFVRSRTDIDAMIGMGGSGGTALITRAMRAMPIGVPKVMVSTMASGNTAPYVGASDIAMVYSITDIAGLNRISRQVLGNAAHAISGMVLNPIFPSKAERQAVGLTMFGVTTPCVQQISRLLAKRFDCLVFHATGTGGQSMEKLLAEGLLSGLLDITTTEVSDFLFGGVLACTDDRFGAVARTRAPYVGSCGALDMVNFGAPETVPERYRGRRFYPHNPQVTLMRTTVEENSRQAKWIAARLNQCDGEVRFLLPMGGVSALDAPDQPFWDREADEALFETITAEFHQTSRRKLLHLPYHINDPQFSEIAVEQFMAISR